MKKSELKAQYCVIGGQYRDYCRGERETLLGAKRLAGKSMEYWDNWQGWHIPKIYKIEDTEIVPLDGESVRVPKPGATAAAKGTYKDGKITWKEGADMLGF